MSIILQDKDSMLKTPVSLFPHPPPSQFQPPGDLRNTIATAGVLGGVTGLLFGGFWLGAASFVATSYLAKKAIYDIYSYIYIFLYLSIEKVRMGSWSWVKSNHFKCWHRFMLQCSGIAFKDCLIQIERGTWIVTTYQQAGRHGASIRSLLDFQTFNQAMTHGSFVAQNYDVRSIFSILPG